MNIKAKDLRPLYGSIGLALALMVAGAAGVWYATQQKDLALRNLREADRRAGEIRNRLRQVNVEEQEILAKSNLYRDLESRRIIGPEQRLDWIELIDGIREQRRLFEIDYQLSEQRQEDPPIGDLRINTSEMRFHLPLLHEGDLLGFLADLQQRAPAIVQVKHCEIKRGPEKSGRQAGDPNLDARCLMQWTTIGKTSLARSAP